MQAAALSDDGRPTAGTATAGSAGLFEAARRLIPGGVNSTARATWSGWTPYPLFVEGGTGSRLRDVDGNEYIDYLLGLGPMLLGHRPPRVTQAVDSLGYAPNNWSVEWDGIVDPRHIGFADALEALLPTLSAHGAA